MSAPTVPQVLDHGRKTRYALFAVIIFIIIGTVIWTWGSAYAFQDRGIHIDEDSQGNEIESRVVEVLLESEIILVCSGVFIRESGEILTATHCMDREDGVCQFNPTIPGYDFAPDFEYHVEVMGVNDTNDKWIFPFEIVSYSAVTDVAVIKPLPLTLADGSVITVNDQDHFQWDESTELSRGDTIQGLGYDVSFLKKLSHKGYVQAAGKDRGTGFAVSVEQVFVDTDIQPGASGMAMFGPNQKLVMAPLSYRWAYDSSSDTGGGLPQSSARITASGTSSRVSHPLTDRMLNPNTPPNGAQNNYLVPGLGIIPTEVVSAINLWFSWDLDTFVPFTQNRGIIFAFLASQDYYDFLTTTMSECGLPPYTVTPPSMLGAPVDEVISGTPPDPFIDFPGGDPDVTGIMVILEAIEGHLHHRDWHYLGEDAGLTTVSGILMGTGKWVGDQVRVRIRAINPALPADPASNWEAIYLVTLQVGGPLFESTCTQSH